MSPHGYPTGYKYYADAGTLNAFDGSTIKGMGFDGVIPYIGIGGGGSLPDKRLTQARYLNYKRAGLEVPGAFVERDTSDADSGYNGGVANATAALNDLESMGISIQLIIAVNDKTTFNQADVDYVRGFRDTVGYNRTGVYGFSNYLRAVRTGKLACYYHQCGDSPIATGTDTFVNVWQRNDGYYKGLDVNQLLINWGNGENDMIKFFARNGSGDVNKGFTDIVMEVGAYVFPTDWAQYQAKKNEGVAILTGLDDGPYTALVGATQSMLGMPAQLNQLLQKLDMPIDMAGVKHAISTALIDAGDSIAP